MDLEALRERIAARWEKLTEAVDQIKVAMGQFALGLRVFGLALAENLRRWWANRRALQHPEENLIGYGVDDVDPEEEVDDLADLAVTAAVQQAVPAWEGHQLARTGTLPPSRDTKAGDRAYQEEFAHQATRGLPHSPER